MTDKNYITELFCRLVAADSPSYGENAVRDVILSELASLGITAEEDNANLKTGGTCGNLYVFIDGNSSLEPVLFSSHMDTVEPSRGKKAVVHEDGKITSTGNTVLGSDDVGGLVSILASLKRIKDTGVNHRPIEIVFDTAEEVYCIGIQAFDFTKVKSKQVYVLDLDGRVGRAAVKAPGIVQWKAAFKGVPAHAGFSPELGRHAIKAAAEGIAAIECGRFGDMTVNVGTVSGGRADNIVPEDCTVSGEVRSLDSAEMHGKVHEIGKILTSAADKYGVKCDFREIPLCEPFNTDTDHPVCRRYAAACERRGIEPEFVKTGGCSTNNHWTLHGIDGIVISCAMNNVHSVSEWTTQDELCRSADIVYELMTSD